MVQLTTDQRIFVVKKFHETKSYLATQEAFRVAFPNRNPPAKSTIQHNLVKYDRDRTSLNLNKGRSEQRRKVRAQQNIDRLRTALQTNHAR